MNAVESFAGPGDRDPRDTRDLARDVVVNRTQMSEQTLQRALQRAREELADAQDDQTRQAWREAQQALLGALATVRRQGAGQ